SCCNVAKTVEVNNGLTATFNCEYSQNHIYYSKIIFKEKKDSIDEMINTTQRKNCVFTGTITGLTAEDAGKYWCAVTLETELNYLYTHLIVIMNEELNLIKYERDDVSIQCRHHDEDQKIFCKHMKPPVYFSMIIIISVCVILLLIGGFTLTVCKLRHKRRVHLVLGAPFDFASCDIPIIWRWWTLILLKNFGVFSERFTLFQNNEGNLMIYIIELNTQDAGRYQVGLDGQWIIDITLNVEEAKVGVSIVSGSSGGGLMIKCEHPQYKTNPKYICKESDGCSERKNPGVQGEWMENGDVSLYDDTRAGVLMVFFRELKAADAGTYRCGVNVSDYTESFTELQLSVRHDFSMIIIISVCVILLLIGGFTLTVCKLRHKRRDPGSVQSHDELPTIPSDELLYAAVSFQKHEESLSEATVRFNFSMIIIISVSVILLLIGGFTLTVCKLRDKRKGRIATSDKRKRKKNTISSCADSRRDSLSDPGSAQMKNHDDLPTIPSDGLLYAAVSFQKHEESLSDATVIFSENEIQSDYATIKFTR
ncbi:hypothetical protein cypCar_00043773, partial [Cyprinus carpio]